MQGSVCFLKFICYASVHGKQRYDLGVLSGHCTSQWNLRDTCLLIGSALYCCKFIESQSSEKHVHKFQFYGFVCFFEE